MLEFPIDIYADFENQVFKHFVRIPMGTNCAQVMTDLFLHLYAAKFIQHLLKCKSFQKSLTFAFNSTLTYIDDVLSKTILTSILTSTRYICQWTWKKDSTQSASSALFLVILLESDIDGNLTTKHYDKRNDFNFSKFNFPYVAKFLHSLQMKFLSLSEFVMQRRALHNNKAMKLLTKMLIKQKYKKSWLK